MVNGIPMFKPNTCMGIAALTNTNDCSYNRGANERFGPHFHGRTTTEIDA
jgi:hypothetical protein